MHNDTKKDKEIDLIKKIINNNSDIILVTEDEVIDQ